MRSEREIDAIVERERAAERERCAKIVLRICGETRHVTLGDKIVREIDNLKSEEH